MWRSSERAAAADQGRPRVELEFLLAFGLQAVFFWAIFLYCKQISARLVAATTGSGYSEKLPQMKVVRRGAEVATRPFSALVAGATFRRGTQGGRQESALSGPSGEARGSASVAEPPDTVPHVNGNGNGHAPASAQRAGNRGGRPPAPDDPLGTIGTQRSSAPSSAHAVASDPRGHEPAAGNGKPARRRPTTAPCGMRPTARPARPRRPTTAPLPSSRRARHTRT